MDRFVARHVIRAPAAQPASPGARGQTGTVSAMPEIGASPFRAACGPPPCWVFYQLEKCHIRQLSGAGSALLPAAGSASQHNHQAPAPLPLPKQGPARRACETFGHVRFAQLRTARQWPYLQRVDSARWWWLSPRREQPHAKHCERAPLLLVLAVAPGRDAFSHLKLRWLIQTHTQHTHTRTHTHTYTHTHTPQHMGHMDVLMGSAQRPPGSAAVGSAARLPVGPGNVHLGSKGRPLGRFATG